MPLLELGNQLIDLGIGIVPVDGSVGQIIELAQVGCRVEPVLPVHVEAAQDRDIDSGISDLSNGRSAAGYICADKQEVRRLRQVPDARHLRRNRSIAVLEKVYGRPDFLFRRAAATDLQIPHTSHDCM